MVADPRETVCAVLNDLVAAVARHAVYIEVLKGIVDGWRRMFFEAILGHNAACLTLYSEGIENSGYYVNSIFISICIEHVFDESRLADGCYVDLVGEPTVNVVVVDNVFQWNARVNWFAVCIYGDGM